MGRQLTCGLVNGRNKRLQALVIGSGRVQPVPQSVRVSYVESIDGRASAAPFAKCAAAVARTLAL
jgi:hypothetical protein